MNKFLKQLLVFLIPIFILILSIVYLQLFSINQVRNFKIPSNINKLIIGDSHTKLAVDDSILTNSLNISQDSESYIFSYYNLKELIKKNKQIDTILLSCSFHNFAKYYDISTYHSDVVGKYFFILPFSVQIEFMKKSNNPMAVLKDSYINFWNNYFSETKSFIGLYYKVKRSYKISDYYVNKRVNRQYGDVYEYLYSTINEKYLNKIGELCLKNNVKLVLIKTPLHKKYKSKLPGYIINHYYSIINNFDLIEYNIKLDDTDFMPDGDHLSRSGAIKYSNYLKDYFIKK